MNTRSKRQKPPTKAESFESNYETDAESSGFHDESDILGDGSSDDDEEDPEDLSSGDEDAESPDANDEDDIIVAQWRRNSYSESTLVLFFNLQCLAAIYLICNAG
jgi:hypothetical protein